MCKKGKIIATVAKQVVRFVVKRQAKKAMKGHVHGIALHTSPLFSSAASILKGPALKAFLGGPIIKPIAALGRLLRSVPLRKLPALVKQASKALRPALAALHVGPVRVSLLALLRVLKLSSFMAFPLLAGVSGVVLLIRPAVSVFLKFITTGFLEIMTDLIEPLHDLLLSSPLVKGALTAVRPIFQPLLSLLQVLMSGDTLLPLLTSVMALPDMLANGVPEADGVPPSLPSAHDLLKGL
ncbi:MAG: uncharacterized protein KVP18_000613 [Porospora cf. gigantea A]|uniref:uncharacterized protein n=1 Tax=Porospora cf. gigantea A TaxID=2853593 RepID=UPI00355A1ABD|nr:MAG: hypothetical protein KVP18_000613 [Porospora cf. gigantea A]